MAKPPVHDDEVPKIPNNKRAIFHKHLAIHVLLEEQKAKLNARVAANKKAAEQHGIPGKKIKVTHDLSKKPPSEVAKHYAEEFELLEFQGVNLPAQFNIFGGVDVTAPKKGPDYYGAGLFAAINGKDGNPPKNLKGPDQQRWIEGWQDGVAARVLGKEYLDNADAILDAANNDGKPAASEDGQTDLEDATAQALLDGDTGGGEVIRIGVSDFGPKATLETIELEDLDLPSDQIEKARRIEVVDADGRVNILKNADGETGIQDPLNAGDDGFEARPEELAAQTARPSTQAASDPAKED